MSLELRQDEVEGATLAEDDCRVAVEVYVVLDGLGLDPRESPLRLLEDAVQEDGEDDAREPNVTALSNVPLHLLPVNGKN